jgi:CRP-like cAMP-binding protein
MSYEKKSLEEMRAGKLQVDRVDIPFLKYFWQASPLGGKNKNTIPKFLRKIEVFKNFSDFELKILSKYLHKRNFKPNEVIFTQGDPGVGFYLLFSGHVEIYARREMKDIPKSEIDERDFEKSDTNRTIVLLESMDYFGELALLQELGIRTAGAVAKDDVVLLGIFKPDIDDLIGTNPSIAAKLLQTLSIIVAERFNLVSSELQIARYKISQLEQKIKNDKK